MKVLHISPKDNVVTCLQPVSKGETLQIEDKAVIANDDVPVFHKMAIVKIEQGSLCYKYGEIIGQAVTTINQGDHVHVHNIESTRGRGDKAH